MHKIYKDFFDDKLVSTKYDNLLNHSIWKFEHSTVGPYSYWTTNLREDVFYNNVILERINRVTGNNHILFNVFAIGQTYGQAVPTFHDDVDDNEMTFLIFMNPVWDISWGGTFIFQKENEATVWPPAPNSGIYFNSNLVHTFNEPSKNFTHLRAVIVYKLGKY